MRVERAIINSIVNIINIFVNSLLSLVVRSVLIRYIGIEVLGVESVVVEIVNTLSLLEMGIQSAIIYRLYKPVAAKNNKREQEIFNILRKSYITIGSIILVCGVLLIPVLGYIVNTKLALEWVLVIYLIQLICVGCGFYISYHRCIFLVHEKQYFCSSIDIALQVIIGVLQIGVLTYYHNYIIYISLNFFRVLATNLLIRKKSRKQYSYLYQRCKINRDDRDNVLHDVKEIAFGNFAGYVYNSTDSMIIAGFCGSLIVGYIANYKTITNLIKTVINSVHVAVLPSIGNYVHENSKGKNVLRLYNMILLLDFMMCILLLVPTYCLADSFIVLWLGMEYLIEESILFLIIMDIFVNTVNAANGVFLNAFGLFREDKIVSIVGTSINILLSIILVIKFEEKGVLFATVIALVIFFAGRSYFVNARCFEGDMKLYSMYIKDNIKYTVFFVCITKLMHYIFERYIEIDNVFSFMLTGFALELVLAVICYAFCFRNKVFEDILTYIIYPKIKK